MGKTQKTDLPERAFLLRMPTLVGGLIASRREPATVGTWRQITPRKESTEATKQQQNFWLWHLCRRRSSRSRETPAPTRESAFGTTTSLEGLAAWTERTDEDHVWLPFRSRNPGHGRRHSP